MLSSSLKHRCDVAFSACTQLNNHLVYACGYHKPSHTGVVCSLNAVCSELKIQHKPHL